MTKIIERKNNKAIVRFFKNKANKQEQDPTGLTPSEPGAKLDAGKITAPQLLEKARQHMLDREVTYDQPGGERSMGKTVEAFNAITGRDLSESEGWLLLDVLKQVRLFAAPGYHADSAEDHIAYAALMAEAKARENQNNAT